VPKCVNIITKKLENYSLVANNDYQFIVVSKVIKDHLISNYIG